YIPILSCLVFFSDAATPEIYTLSLHDALPISRRIRRRRRPRSTGRPSGWRCGTKRGGCWRRWSRRQSRLRLAGPDYSSRRFTAEDRKSTRLNSSHVKISYAVFCLKKKKKKKKK